MSDEGHFLPLNDGTLLYVPPNKILRIDCLWAFIFEDTDGNEDLCAAPMSIGAGVSMTMPLIATDEARLASLKPIAAELSRKSGMRIKLVKLSDRAELDRWP